MSKQLLNLIENPFFSQSVFSSENSVFSPSTFFKFLGIDMVGRSDLFLSLGTGINFSHKNVFSVLYTILTGR